MEKMSKVHQSSTTLIGRQLVNVSLFSPPQWTFGDRFGIYGALIMGPAMFVWVRYAAVIFPRTNFKSALSKAITEQITVDPICILAFLFVMSLLEEKTVAEAKEEVSHPFLFLYHLQQDAQ